MTTQIKKLASEAPYTLYRSPGRGRRSTLDTRYIVSGPAVVMATFTDCAMARATMQLLAQAYEAGRRSMPPAQAEGRA